MRHHLVLHTAAKFNIPSKNCVLKDSSFFANFNFRAKNGRNEFRFLAQQFKVEYFLAGKNPNGLSQCAYCAATASTFTLNKRDRERGLRSRINTKAEI